MLVDYSSDDGGQNHRLVVKYESGKVETLDFAGTLEKLFDDYKLFFTLPERCYVPEDCRGQSGKYAEFLSLRLS